MFCVPFKNKCFNVRISEQINCKSQVLRIIITHILTLLVHIKMFLIIHYKSPTALWLKLFCVSVNLSYCVFVPPFVSLFYFNTPAPFFLYAFGELHDLLNSFRMSNNRTSCSVLSTYFRQNISIVFTFQYIIVRVRYRVWCERNKRRQRVVCNNIINALFVSLLYLNMFDIFRFKVFYWVFESYFLKKKKKDILPLN